MSSKSVYITGAGIISPLGNGLEATLAALRANISAIRPLSLFSLLSGSPLPVGECVDVLTPDPALPRSHQLALTAAQQAMSVAATAPDAVIIGTTTGGILTTEGLLRAKSTAKKAYQYHGINTIAQLLAEKWQCPGPALTVSTACSSGVVALALALAMLQTGEVDTVLAGGVDSLCRLTYYGFHSLQVVDPTGAHPLDVDRAGMSVAEGAAMLLLSREPGAHPLGALLGAGLSCDAHHPVAPHPEGRGAAAAMAQAMAKAGLDDTDIDYINLHGTGTRENDQAEAKAVHRLFPALPPLSSIKGATGHSLAASGAIEAVVALLALNHDLLPANTALANVDPALGLTPVPAPQYQALRTVLSSSFGFGGNNGSVVLSKPGAFAAPQFSAPKAGLAVYGSFAISGAGADEATMAALRQGEAVAGLADVETISANLPAGLIRRLKRLPRLAMALAVGAENRAGLPDGLRPNAIFMGTGWGAMSETYDFLQGLSTSAEKFPSPMDFVGSVHNGPASQIALLLGATGANITTSGRDYSFEQALFSAELCLAEEEVGLVLGADEGHPVLSSLLDGSIAPGSALADGGGALCLGRQRPGAHCQLNMLSYQALATEAAVQELRAVLQGQEGYDLCLVGIPSQARAAGEAQLKAILAALGADVPCWRYRQSLGEFASASALAAVTASELLRPTTVPLSLPGQGLVIGACRRILQLGLGTSLTALEFQRL